MPIITCLGDECSQYHPKPDLRYELRAAQLATGTLRPTCLPLVVFEFESDSNQQDLSRLLAQCMVYVRLAKVSGIQIKFDGRARAVVMACYVSKQYDAAIYLLTTKDDSDEVRIYQSISYLSH